MRITNWAGQPVAHGLAATYSCCKLDQGRMVPTLGALSQE